MTEPAATPLETIEQIDDFAAARYRPDRKTEEFRQFTVDAPAVVQDFYHKNHGFQTLDFVRAKKAEYGQLAKRTMGVWEAMEYLNTLVDDSDPDTDLSQIEHGLQTAESLRRDGHPHWMILTGLIHDLGKILCLFGEPQWAVVGDTFPVGCAWSDKIVFREMFDTNPDRLVPEYQTQFGIYSEGCGLKNVHLSWGHDEYLAMVTERYLPEEAIYMIRYHSCYPWHRENQYFYFMDDKDRAMLPWVKKFNPYDLYSKSDTKPDAVALRPYYEELIAEFFPAKINW